MTVLKYATRLDPVWVRRVAKTPPPWGPLGYFTYKRTYARKIKELGRTEQLHESLERAINAVLDYGGRFTVDEAEALFLLGYQLQGLPGGRMLWQLGTPTVERLGGDSLFNCWWTLTRGVDDFCFAFDRAMLGGGVGFKADGSELPVVVPATVTHTTEEADWQVPDDREGWVELLRRTYRAFFGQGPSFTYGTRLVRKKGSPIHGFGGVASGPEPLIEGVGQLANLFGRMVGRRPNSVDVIDIHTIQGSIVVSGNVRRTALIGVGSPGDVNFLHAKRWDLGPVPGERGLVNLTCDVDDVAELSDEYWHGFEQEGEQFGLMNGRLIRETDPTVTGTNPCQPGFATVLTPDGIRTFDDIDTGSVIWSGKQWTRVSNKWATGVKPVYRYTTTAGEFVGTDKHRVVQGGVKIEVGEADAIDSSKCVTASAEPVNSQDVMDGWVVGDGTVHKASNNLVYLCVGQDDGCIHLSEVAWLISRHRPGMHAQAWEVQTTVQADELPLTYERRVPNRFLQGDTTKVRGFLRGLYAANGSVCGGRVTLKASSFGLVKQVQQMLSSIGIASYHTTNKSKVVKFDNGDYECRESYDLNITTDRTKFALLIGFIHPSKQVRLNSALEIGKSAHRGKQTYDIVGEQYLGDMPVYDITVEVDEHTYWTGGCLVSNCAEANLEDKEPCCLTELFVSRMPNMDRFVDGAKLLYRVAKTTLQLPFMDRATQEVVRRNQRMGLGVTGLRGAKWGDEHYRAVYAAVRDEDRRYSREIKANESIKITTVKPSGTLSLLPGVQSGVHGDVSPYYVRRIRVAESHPLVNAARDHGYYVEKARDHNNIEDERTMVVSFPVERGVVAGDAIEQLKFHQRIQECWSDQSVSVTVTFRPDEVPAIKSHLAEHFRDGIKTVSFMKDYGHGFVQTPNEPISRDLHRHLSHGLRPITDVDVTEEDYELETSECNGGSCPTR